MYIHLGHPSQDMQNRTSQLLKYSLCQKQHTIIIAREAREKMYLVVSIRPSVRPSAHTLMAEPLPVPGGWCFLLP